MIRRRDFAYLAVIAAMAAGLAAPASYATPARASHSATSSARDRAPECVKVEALNPDGTHTWLVGCGSGPGNESWISDLAAGKTVTVDGASLRGDNCGTSSSPCVLFPNFTTPHS